MDGPLKKDFSRNKINFVKKISGKYGKAMVELCSEIERNIRQFKIPPIGPLGKYIKLTRNTGNNENLANLLQNQIGVKLLNSFLVDNTPDRKTLQKLMEKQNFSKIPRIETKKRYELFHSSKGSVCFVLYCV